ncbi:MAG TPA: BTAD domain-containing putative transcriptional regulator [Candidatus Limnocylindrales bacterium]|nr:BTAD domain-containing putative transcriptional regulator [Candidatus Limnocylindrales bacterium]
MRIRILGPLRVWDGEGWVPISGSQQRILLAVMLVESGRLVAKDRLIDEVWGERPIRTAATAVSGYVMRLRRLLRRGGAADIITRATGYELVIEDGALDASVFERCVRSGKAGTAEGKLADAVDRLADGLALWQGPALADVPATPIVSAEVTRLEQLRLSALEERFGIRLELGGQYAQIADELSALVREHPLRERLSAHLMMALYRCGRRAEALETYRRVRTVLVEQTGIEPGPALRELERAILNDDSTFSAPTGSAFVPAVTPAVVPAQLPGAVPGFAGRAAHLHRLNTILRDEAQILVTIDGLAGVGKTALALHWAHRVRDRFPDGQLFIDLRGYSDHPPARPLEALARFLQALGVTPERIPLEVEQAAALYRSLLAGKRVLVVLDNAADPSQVRPLLPGVGGCLALVTSRDQLLGLTVREGATRLRLEALSPTEARDLLVGLLGNVDSVAAAELARLCGHLPLAMRIAVANLQAQRVPVSAYNKRLANGDRLAVLEITGDPTATTTNAFDLSYQAQPVPAQRLFRLLGIAPGTDVTAQVAAALAP